MSTPLRIMRAPGTAKVEEVASPAPTAADGMKEYLGRLLKLIPTEVVGLYMVGTGILQQQSADPTKPNSVACLVWAVICFILVIVVRVFGTSDAKTPPEVPLVVISAVSFLVWIYSLSGPCNPFTVLGVPGQFAWMAVLVWTFLIPFIYKQKPS